MTTMHFGPEWMRNKQQSSSRMPHPPSPPPTTGPAPPSGASTYSALVSPVGPQLEQRDEAHPFRYSKEEMLRIYKENTGKGGLGLEVERWEGVVREVGSEPVGLREMGEDEKKLFAGPTLNSELRRRQSTDFLSPQNASPRLNTGTSPLRDRFIMKRRDSTDQVTTTTPRKLSLTGAAMPLASPRDTGMASPRTRYGPGFDGILNNGDSWVARRRASEGLLKAAPTREGSGDLQDSGGLQIKEEDEPIIPVDSSSSESDSGQNLDRGLANLHITPNGQPIASGPPPGIVDLASVEWSYLDPQGTIQGPFRADLMQKWHDEGYFTPDLLMKRTTLDLNWTPVGVLANLAGAGKLFLSPVTVPPPANARTDSPQQGIPPLSLRDSINPPYQPSPIRSLRSSTLDSYINGSNPSSPASSFGAARFGDSPDPAAFGGTANNNYAPVEPPARVGAFNSEASGRRNTFGDSVPLGNLAGPRAGSTDNFAYNSTFNAAGQSPWQHAPANGPSNFEPGREQIPYPNSYGGNLGTDGPNSYVPHLMSQEFNDPSSGGVPFDYGLDNGRLDDKIHENNLGGNYAAFSGAPYPNSQHYGPSSSANNLSNVYDNQTAPRLAPQQNGIAPQISPWGPTAEAPTARRPGPFDPTHPTAANTTIMPQAWGNVEARSITQNNEIAQQYPQVSSETWSGEPGPSNQRQSVPSGLPGEPEVGIITKKARTKSTSVPQPATNVTKLPVVVPQTFENPPTPPPLSASGKPAWSKDDETMKPKPSGVALSLREIQEAELKKAEARKVAERERERATRMLTAATPAEETQAFTASWGLPTSQAGARTATLPVKESNNTPSAQNVPVWTAAAKPTAPKTMKEIQEEEERRKKAAAKENAAAIAARRGYADTAHKSSAPPAVSSPWTTIGPSGKAALPARPTLTTTASAVSSTSVPRANGAPIPRPAVVVTVKASPTSAKADENPVPPSHDFLKWLNDSLKGLNSSVNVEEIMSMLLTFPLDPDPSTVELISDLIYANSTTLDGRRFATEYVSRRKTDAASRPRGAGVTGAGSGKPVSIADVVKAQPKAPVSSEWGGFKVVNKKKKGGRS
ncbi:hypothetical protein C8J56DRAFT_1021249 [Mycena floridula]|nr:hypothetical protein C8J56DRAFT_1021249 [Mycena floridula]